MSNNSESTVWRKLQEIKEKNPLLWRLIIAGVAVLAVVILFLLTNLFAPELGKKLWGLLLTPFNLITGLFSGNKADNTVPQTPNK